MSASDSPAFKAMIKPTMMAFDKLLAELDKQIAAVAAALSADTQQFESIISVPGIGLLSGSALLGLFRTVPRVMLVLRLAGGEGS